MVEQVSDAIRKKHYSISTEQAMECVRLRVKDIDFEQNRVIVREGKELRKGDKSLLLTNKLSEQTITFQLLMTTRNQGILSCQDLQNNHKRGIFPVIPIPGKF